MLALLLLVPAPSIGVLFGMVIRYRSIWPGYVSHALVDMCIFGVGAHVLFGAR